MNFEGISNGVCKTKVINTKVNAGFFIIKIKFTECNTGNFLGVNFTCTHGTKNAIVGIQRVGNSCWWTRACATEVERDDEGAGGARASCTCDAVGAAARRGQSEVEQVDQYANGADDDGLLHGSSKGRGRTL